MPKNSLSRYADRLGEWCSRASTLLTALLLIFMALLITVDVIGRGAFSKPTLIADAASGYALVGIVFLGLAVSEWTGKHVTVQILTRRLPPSIRAYVEAAVLIITLAFAIWFLWILFGVVKVNYVNQTVSIDALHIRMWIPYSVGPIGTGIFALVLLAKVIQRIRFLVSAGGVK
jgi:TRAP-type C4-dicarboxylate transport system permease small subunit